MICFLLPQSTHKNSILYHKAVKVMINASNFAKIIVNVIVCLSVVTNSGALYTSLNLSLLFYFYRILSANQRSYQKAK